MSTQKTKKYVVQYEIQHYHVVEVGIEAQSKAEAESKASAAFDDLTLWDDTDEMPLLHDDFEESDDGTPLTFEATEVDVWPEKDRSVHALKRDETARKIAHCLADMWRRGAPSGRSTGWEELDDLYALALSIEPTEEGTQAASENTDTMESV